MDLSKFADIAGIVSLIIIVGPFIWKKGGFFSSKIKNIGLFLYQSKVRQCLLRVYQRIFQPRVEIESKPSLRDGNKSFNYKSKSDEGIRLPINISGETEIFDGVIGLKAAPIDPFLTSLYSLDIEQNKPGYMLFGKCILGIDPDEVSRLKRQCYFREIVESQNN